MVKLVLTEDETMLADSARGFLDKSAPVKAFRDLRDAGQTVVDGMADPLWFENGTRTPGLRSPLLGLAAHYFLHARNGRAEPLNAVARFHLGNGARLDRINWLADVSARGLAESFGLMANYVYELKDIERNHEAFVNAGTVTAASAVKKLAKSLPGGINTAPTAATTLPDHPQI